MQIGWRRHGDTLLLIGALTAVTLLWALYPHGLNASDPWYYALRAHHLLETGDWSLRAGRDIETFDFRSGVVLPTALIYRWFGIGLYTTHLLPLVAALAIVVIVWLASPDATSRCAATLLCVVSVPLLDGAVDLYPDLVAAAFMAMSVLMLTRRHGEAPSIAAVVGVCCAFAAFTAKENAYWLVPVWLFALSGDLRTAVRGRVLRRFYAVAAGTGFLLAVLYLVWSQALWGDALIRFKVASAALKMENAAPDSWWTVPRSYDAWLRRLTVDPPLMLWRAYGPAILLAAIGFILMPRAIAVWGVYVASCIAFLWLGPTGWAPYQVLPLYPRYGLAALPGIYILAGYGLARVARCVAPLAGTGLAATLLLVLAAAPFAFYVARWRDVPRGEERAMALVEAELAREPARSHVLVTADRRSAEALAFFFGFRYPANLRVVAAANAGTATPAAEHTLLYMNGARSRFLSSTYGERVFDAEFRAAGWPVLLHDDEVTLYAGDGNNRVPWTR